MRALETLGVRRLVVATSYIDEVTNHLVKYLTDSGFEVAGATGLGFTTIAEMHGVDTPTLVELCERTYAQAPDSDAWRHVSKAKDECSLELEKASPSPNSPPRISLR